MYIKTMKVFQSQNVSLGNSTVCRYSNSPAPPKRLLNVIGEPPIQYYEANRRNAYR